MISRIRDRLGPAGFVLAIVALVAALGGGAYAASGGLNGRQKTEVKKIAQTEAKKFETAGPAGPAGANGKDGSSGSNGKDGAQGAQGPQGPQGPQGLQGKDGKDGKTGFTKVLPPGETETGTWFFAGNGNAENGVALSFPIPLSATDAASMKSVFVTGAANFAQECPGTLAAPAALPGNLCVYFGNPSSKNPGSFYQPDFTTEVEAAGLGTGGVIGFIENSLANTLSYGSFAVTAPLGP
jgi:hypothetical protein